MVNADGTFDETGTITYGSLGIVEFKTLGKGYMFPSSIEGLQRWGVLWEVTRGTGQFAGATGVITSNFSVASDGTVVDNHFAVLYLPEWALGGRFRKSSHEHFHQNRERAGAIVRPRL